MNLAIPRGRRTTGEQALALWQEYQETGDKRLRDHLVTMHLPLVRFIVYKKMRELPARYEVDDLVSSGVLAIMTALDRYDPAKGATLEQFLWTRVHGAIIDELRRDDPATRSLRRWEREAAAERRQFHAEHHREPTREELAGRLETTPEAIRAREHELANAKLESLNIIVAEEDDATIERGHTLESSDHSLDPESAAMTTGAKDAFRAAFANLPAREREVAVMIYAGDMTLRDIGERLGVSESRVCQIHGELKRRLKQTLAPDQALFNELA